MRKKGLILVVLLLLTLLLVGCGSDDADDLKEVTTFEQIAMSQAKELLETTDGYILLDVRRVDEYDSGHIPGAMLLPNEDIPVNLEDYENMEEKSQYLLDFEAEAEKEQVIYVYCRSGNRSKQAAQKLVDLGYTSVVEIGGIQSWTGEIV